MANYYCACRTNHFHVTDEDAYAKLVKGLSAEDFYVYNEPDKDGRISHFIGGYDSLNWGPPVSPDIPNIKEAIEKDGAVYDENDNVIDFNNDTSDITEVYNESGDIIYDKYSQDDYDIYDFFKALQPLLPENEYVYFIQAGHEKLRYVSGFCIFVTKDTIQFTNSDTWVSDNVKKYTNQDGSDID